jgi:hypothetical protein
MNIKSSSLPFFFFFQGELVLLRFTVFSWTWRCKVCSFQVGICDCLWVFVEQDMRERDGVWPIPQEIDVFYNILFGLNYKQVVAIIDN